MQAFTYDMSVTRGDTFNGVVFTLIVNGHYVNLRNTKIQMDVRSQENPAFVLASFSNGTGITVLSKEEGKYQLDPQIFDLGVGAYTHSTRFTFPTGAVKTYIKGTLSIEAP